MILHELFDRNGGVTRVPKYELPLRIRDYYEIAMVWKQEVAGEAYLFYMARGDDRGEYIFNFGRKIVVKHPFDPTFDEEKLDYNLTGKGIPFTILSSVYTVLADFVRAVEPKAVVFNGSTNRQDEFYSKLLKFAPRLGPYEGRESPRAAYIIRVGDDESDLDESALTELFDPAGQVEEIDAAEAMREYNLESVYKAYLLPIREVQYVLYFEGPWGEGRYSFSFGKVGERRGKKYLSYLPTDTTSTDQFKVIRAIFEASQDFITTEKPTTITFSGVSPRQDQFYERLIPYFKKKFEPYKVVTQGPKIALTLDPAYRGTVVEGAEEDIGYAKQAQEIVNSYINWLAHRENEDKPLKDIMFKYQRGEELILYAPADRFGGPADLNLGFSFNYRNNRDGFQTKAYLAPGRGEMGKRIWFANIITDKDLSNETDVAYSAFGPEQKSQLVHEIIHYFDYQRHHIPQIKTHAEDTHAEYFNSPKEFNAYFQQGVAEIMKWYAKELKNRAEAKDYATFPAFKKAHMWMFDWDFRNRLDDNYRQKFNRRLYKLWELLKAKLDATPVAEPEFKS